MMYYLDNQALCRGFRTYGGGRTRIIRLDGKEVLGTWITGNLSKFVPVSIGEVAPQPYFCLTQPGQNPKLSRDIVSPETLCRFTGTVLETDWDELPQTTKKKWLQHHTSKEWKGIPVFEGDLFQDRISKSILVVIFDGQDKFYLENTATGERESNWYFDLLKPCGNLWQPPKKFQLEKAIAYQMRHSALLQA